MQTDRRVWHQAIATLTPDERIAAELEASAERFRARGGHASATTAYERAAKLSQTESARVTAPGHRRRVGLRSRADRAGAQPGRPSHCLPPTDLAAPICSRLRGMIDGFGGSLADAVSSLLEGIELSDDASFSLEMLLEACGMAMSSG